jgi:hypothetical protein
MWGTGDGGGERRAARRRQPADLPRICAGSQGGCRGGEWWPAALLAFSSWEEHQRKMGLRCWCRGEDMGVGGGAMTKRRGTWCRGPSRMAGLPPATDPREVGLRCWYHEEDRGTGAASR